METTLAKIHASRIPSAALSILCGIFLAFAAMSAWAAGPITQFSIPTQDALPLGIGAGPDGNVWFCETGRSEIGRITPAGVITEFPTSLSPLRITAGPDGNIWYTASDFDFPVGLIGRISPAGERTEFNSNKVTCGIAVGPDGNLWFTVCDLNNEIGRITPTGTITKFQLPAGPGHPGQFPVSITAGPDGNLWFTEPVAGKVGRISTSGSIAEFALPAGSNPDPIVTGPDGNLWYSTNGKVGRITPTGDAAEYAVSASALVLGPDGNLWFADPPGQRVGRLAITSGAPVVDLELPVGSAFPSAIAAGPDGNVWFADTSGNSIDRIDLSAVCAPGSLCLGGRFEIAASWSGAGSSGTGIPTTLTANAGAFWFFYPSNLEVFVKVLNSCLASGTFSVYVNGLTHLGVTVTVTDLLTGMSRDYVKPTGSPFSLIFDGSTFACP